MKTKYLDDGQQVIVVEETKSGFVVEPLYLDEDGEQFPGNYIFVNRVHNEPPTKSYHKDVTLLIAHAEQLRNEVKELEEKHWKLENDIRAGQRDYASKIDKLKRLPQLELLEDFVDGKITHLFYQCNYSPMITEFRKDVDEYSRGELKLLTLHGNTKGDLQWKINRYSDGSGGYTEVVPCISFEQAKEKAQMWINGLEKERYTNTLGKFASEHGLTIPAEFIKHEQQKRYSEITKRLDELKEKTSQVEKELLEAKKELGYEDER